MFSYRLLTKILIPILVMMAFLCGGISMWQYFGKRQKRMFSDQQIVWLLVGLLIIAVISMGSFLLILLKGLEPWYYLRI